MMVPASGQKPAFGPVISAILDPIVQMCEQAAEAHKSKGAGHSSRRSGMSFDCGQLTKSSVDAILSNSSSVSSSLSQPVLFLLVKHCYHIRLLVYNIHTKVSSGWMQLKGFHDIFYSSFKKTDSTTHY
ncbi:hypothetical protein GLYMA_01G154551v4 [Glycine max]|nr:hypothetical protein GLYMA_01G154551v4 [Glycine max]KAH1163256.1 hypothetical protein GYH30_001681 [Glycine max]